LQSGLCPEFTPQNAINCFKLYETKTNRQIGKYSSLKIGEPLGWVYGQGHLMLFQERMNSKKAKTQGRDYKVIEIGSDEIIDTFHGNVVNQELQWNWISSDEVIVIEPTGSSEQRKARKGIILRTLEDVD
jgi:hypothetical protein